MQQPHRPNQVPRSERVFNTLAGLFLLGWGASGFVHDSLRISRRGTLIALLTGRPAWLMGLALVLGACVLLSVVIDHYDRRPTERYYAAFRWAASRLAWCAAASALVAHLYVFFAQ